MKVKTSVTLSEELLDAIAHEITQENRSAFIEEAAWRHLRILRRQLRDQRERDTIDEHAETLNAEAMDVLDYQDHQ